MKKFSKYIKNFLITIISLICAFGLSLLFQYIFEVQEHITTVFVFAVFLISLLTDGYFYGVVGAFIGTIAVNYAFTFPYFALNFTIPVNMISGIIMIAIAVFTSALTTKLKQHEATKAESEKERMRANLLRAVSHDLRTPLTTIYASSTTLLEDSNVMTAEQKSKIVAGIKEDSEWLIRMVENLLSVTKIDSGQIKIIKSPTVLEELIDSVMLKFKKRYPYQKVNIELPDDVVIIPMDALLIEQVIVNILENAVFHAKEMTQLTLSVVCKNGYAEFCVSDDGCGIPADRLDNLFTGYLDCTDTPTDGTRNNMGIGLSVCSTIVKAHGSEIYAKNLSPRGAAFYFSLQMEEAHESEQI